MSVFQYKPLTNSTTHTRLLLLHSPKAGASGLRGQLLEYPICDTNDGNRPYEAVSYLWGNDNRTCLITIGDAELAITQNLYDLLLRLQDGVHAQLLWADGVCINQEDEGEKEAQIPLMAEIYAKARRVIAWLGPAEDDSCVALDTIQLAGNEVPAALKDGAQKRSIEKLFNRAWFRRVWILQEVAAARQLIIMCGPTEIDGHAFCEGLKRIGDDLLDIPYELLFLMEGAIFRPRHLSRKRGRYSLATCSLGTLVDMYHDYGATKPHDKVYALLGMCSDNIDGTGLEPNYRLPWEVLIQRLVAYLIGSHPRVLPTTNGEAVVIQSKAIIFASISQVHHEANSNRRQELRLRLDRGKVHASLKDLEIRCFSQVGARSVRVGDVVCILQGSSKLTIARLCKDHLMVIMLAVEPPEPVQQLLRKTFDVQREPDRDLLLYWNWTMPRYSEDYSNISLAQRTHLGHTRGQQAGAADLASHAERVWNHGLILSDLWQFALGEETLSEAIEAYRQRKDTLPSHLIDTRLNAAAILFHAVENAHQAMIDVLLTLTNLDLSTYNSKFGTPLIHATIRGHADMVEKFLLWGMVDIEGKSNTARTALVYAAAEGADDIVQMLLARGAEVDIADKLSRTPLWYAACFGHANVLRLLLARSTKHLNRRDTNLRSPLSYAAEYGHDKAVALLLETPGIEVDSGWGYSRTPLSWACEWGHEGVVKQLLQTGKVRVQWKLDKDSSLVPLAYAAAHGHEGVMNLLLQMGKADPDFCSRCKRGPISFAAEKGQRAAVALLLATGKVKTKRIDCRNRDPIDYANRNGHEDVAEMLESFKRRSILANRPKNAEGYLRMK